MGQKDRWREINPSAFSHVAEGLSLVRKSLVESTFSGGTLRGDDHRWLRDGRRAEDSPLRLAHSKAQRLKSRLEREAAKLKGPARSRWVDT